MTSSKIAARMTAGLALVVVLAACNEEKDGFVKYEAGVYKGNPVTTSLTDEKRSLLREHAKRQGG